ncbi:RNA polymerase II-associated protein 3 [Apis laboriosa]|uniref:RNA polymerase II-associated protein 3 n=1 Tax=Apis laboriosa TaxID=183418 RepID=UPI001CC418A0|nr:RNA polymerase II-associated protein 3 [Apis laboriosa]
MIETDTNIIHNTKCGQKSLLERYDIPVEHLSYEYISECTNAKKLERIVTILRSGEEGFYPDLTKHAEKCLNVIKPTSIILRKSEPILKRDMLEPNECKEIDKDINDWMSEMQIREKDLEEGKTTLLNPLPSPDIREFKEESLKKNFATNLKNTKNKRIASCDYSAWDKYDVDVELNKIDIREDQQKLEAKKLQQKQKEIIEKKKLEKHTIINTSALTGTELDVMADQEREKGNEAYRAGDYEEALEHYNISIKMNSNIITHNNRAMTYIKLQRYQDALKDCNIVLNVECMNIKALLRRALCLDHLGESSQALADCEAALILEPTNAVAIAGVKKLRKPCESRKIRMTITEEQTEDTNKKLISKLNELEEKKNYVSQFNSNSICYCDKAPGPSRNLNPSPHIKAEYCLENNNRETTIIKNTLSKKSENIPKVINVNTELFKSPVSSNNYSSNVSKLYQEKNDPDPLTTKHKSTFSRTKSPIGTNSVIIEELPNESNNKNYINVEIKSKETTNKNISNTKIKNKNKSSDKQVKLKNLTKNCEKYYLNEKPRKIEMADKYKNKTSKEEKPITKIINNSSKNDFDLEVYAQLLRSVDLNLVLGNELDGNKFSTILHCLEQYFCTSDNIELLNNCLKSISQMKRFSIINMFMSSEDKQVIKNIFNFLEEHGTSEVSSLRQIYCI